MIFFDLEKLRNDYSLKGFYKQRKNRGEIILDTLFKKLTEFYKQVPPSLGFGKAIAYTLSNWDLLIIYLDNPALTPSNNSAENAIRPFVIGCKNWMFSGSPKGAESSAILYSLVDSAKMNNIAASDYFNYILRKLPYCEKQEDYQKLLPFNLTVEILKSE